MLKKDLIHNKLKNELLLNHKQTEKLYISLLFVEKRKQEDLKKTYFPLYSHICDQIVP